jgi:hypothetical protein
MIRKIGEREILLLISVHAMGDKPQPLLMFTALAVLSAAILLTARPAQAREALGVPIPSDATGQGPDRFKSPWDHQTTVRWLERRLSSQGAQVRFARVLDLPEVFASHAPSPSAKTAWSGINVSRYQGSTWIFVIRRVRSP